MEVDFKPKYECKQPQNCFHTQQILHTSLPTKRVSSAYFKWDTHTPRSPILIPLNNQDLHTSLPYEKSTIRKLQMRHLYVGISNCNSFEITKTDASGSPCLRPFQKLICSVGIPLTSVVTIKPISNHHHELCWRHDSSGEFLIKSAYLVLVERSRPQQTQPREVTANLAKI
jgi:hypothetical protein